MSKDACEKIMAGIEDALAYAKGDISKGKAHVVREAPAVDVAAVRRKTGLSREKFAERFGLDPRAVQDWEQGRRKLDRAARILMRVIEMEPEAVDRALSA